MMPVYGTNPNFFNKKIKDWTSRTLATPHPLHMIISNFCINPPGTCIYLVTPRQSLACSHAISQLPFQERHP